ncbi:MAG: HepT-like ribonuclease domain-containing protein [Nanoarchaeota archaeon]
MLEYKLYVNVLLEAIDKIENSVENNRKEFMENSELQDATLMRLQVIGESIKKIPTYIKKQYKEIKWKKFEKLRNIISHKYASVDYNLIWSFIENNLEELKSGIINIK